MTSKVRVVIDTSVFIPCGDKSENKINSIIEFGNEFPKLAEKLKVVILTSTEILREYSTKIKPEIKRCRLEGFMLPKFHSGFIRNLDRILRLRLRKCREISINPYFFHNIETSKAKSYEVNDFVPKEDEKFLKLVLAEASGGDIYLLSVDDHFLKLKNDETSYKKLCNKYPEAKNIKIVLPDEFIRSLKF